MKTNWITRDNFLQPWIPDFSKKKKAEIHTGKETVPSTNDVSQTGSLHVEEYTKICMYNPAQMSYPSGLKASK